MGKTFKFNAKNVTSHKPNEKELEERDWKHIKSKMKQPVRSPSNKEIAGHFDKMHIWPTTNTKNKNKGGHKI